MQSTQILPATESETAAERRQFEVHPAIVRRLILEQSSSVEKAIAELIMNSVDAGAVNVNLEISSEGFRLTDDGRGFGSREEVLRVFEVFGQPHQDGDAKYGRFRVGRGQIMAHASVSWSSGEQRMQVNLEDGSPTLGYSLTTLAERQAECVVVGKFFKQVTDHQKSLSYWLTLASRVAEQVRYVDVFLTINGKDRTGTAALEDWDYEDDFAWYRFIPGGSTVALYDRGVLVSDSLREISVGRSAVIVTKQALKVNMARNEVHWDCPVYAAIREAVARAFDAHLVAGSTLSSGEVVGLVRGLLSNTISLRRESQMSILANRCIEDAFGTLRSVGEMLGGTLGYQDRLVLTCYEAESSMLAERVEREGHAVVLPDWFVSALHPPQQDELARAKAAADLQASTAELVVANLRKALGLAACTVVWVPLYRFSQTLGYSTVLVPESNLTPEEGLVLEVLKAANRQLGPSFRRKLVVGESQDLEAWTDGVTYIAIERESLLWVRLAGGTNLLWTLLMHEYAHSDPSSEQHAHDLAFHERFHTLMYKWDMHRLAESFFRAYARGVAKQQITPSKALRYHVDQMGGLVGKMKAKRGAVRPG